LFVGSWLVAEKHIFHVVDWHEILHSRVAFFIF
jgi:hypothetical protein